MQSGCGPHAPRGLLLLLALFSTLVLVITGSQPSGASAPALIYRKDTVLVAFHPQTAMGARLSTVARLRLGVEQTGQSPFFARLRIRPEILATGGSVRSVLTALRRDPSVRVAEPDYIVRACAIPNDPRFPEQWGLHNTGQTVDGIVGVPDADIDAPEAWSVTPGSDAVVVAVLDSGVDYTHPDLKDNILRDGKGKLVGHDFINNDDDPMDDNDHGTHVAGIIGARGNNGVGISGVSQRVKIMPLKVLAQDNTGDDAAVIQAIDYARTHGAHVINASFDKLSFTQLELEAVQRARDAGILVCAAAGQNIADNDQQPHYPAGYNRVTDNVLSVAATNNRDRLAGFSNSGATTVDLGAPGVDILSAKRGSAYQVLSGTSMAAAFVSGAAALVRARYPSLTLTQLKGRLLGGTDRLATLDGLVATGRLNVNNALEADTVSPAAPSSLKVTDQGETSLRLTWTARGDDGNAGAANRYELRYSTSPITAANFAAASLADHLPDPASSGSTEAYLLDGLAPGTAYYLALRAWDNAGNVSALAVTPAASTLPGPSISLLDDDVEGTPLFVADRAWTVTTEDHASGSHSYTDSPGALYPNDLDATLTQKAAVTPGGSSPFLSFRARTDLETSYDFLYVEAVADGNPTVQRLLTLTGPTPWTTYTVPLTAFRGRSLKIRFHMVTDFERQRDGVWLDDIRISSDDAGLSLLEDTVEGGPQFTGQGPWAVTTEKSFSRTHSYTDSPGKDYANNLDISLVQNASVTLTGIAPRLTFWAATDLETDLTVQPPDYFDFLYVEVSTDDGDTWRRLSSLYGARPPGFYNLSLAQYYGQTVKIRFRLVTDESTTAGGAWLDDIRIGGERLTSVGGSSPPAAPSALTAAGVSETRIDLAWKDNSADETGFRIDRKVGNGSFVEIGQAAGNDKSFSDTGVTAGNSYTYRVRAVNGAGSSPPSNEATASPRGSGKLSVSRTVSFGKARVRRTVRKSLQVRNTSRTEALRVTLAAPGAPFGASPVGTFTLAPGRSQTVRLTFRATRRGTARGVLAITSSDPANAAVNVSLAGVGR
jgi:hypothetical protein